MTSWAQALAHHGGGDASISVSSLRSSGSDTTITSLSRTIASPRVSPGHTLGVDTYHSASPESDITVEVGTTRYLTSLQETFLQNEAKFLSDEIINVRGVLNNKIAKCNSNCWRDMVWNGLIVNDLTVEDDNKKNKKKGSHQTDDASINAFYGYVNEWRKANDMEKMDSLVGGFIDHFIMH